MACTVTVLPKVQASTPSPGTSASPGFTWGRKNAVTAGTFLENDGVPSNVAGRIVTFDGNITGVFVTSQDDDTFDVDIVYRTGPNTFTTLTTVSLIAQRANNFSVLVPVLEGYELAALISDGGCSNVDVGVIIEQA